MKAKIYSLLLVVMLAFIPATASAQSRAEMRSALSQTAAEMNKMCPYQIDDDMYITSLALQQSSFVMNISVGSKIRFSTLSESEKNALKAEMKSFIVDDEDYQLIMQICSLAGCDLKINLKDSKGGAMVITIPCR